jgi:hypothetical protein
MRKTLANQLAIAIGIIILILAAIYALIQGT